MFAYIIHVERKDIQEWNINVRVANERTPALRFYNSNHIRIDTGLDEFGNNPADAETWYSTDEAAANLLARKLAWDRPGAKVCVYKLASMTHSSPGMPEKAIYTEKGLVPE